MFKRLCLAFAGLFALVSLAQGAGTVPGFSLTPQFGLTGAAIPGCKLYIIQAGTTSTPQNAYQDTGLTQVLPNPLTCDAAARVQQWFVADGLIKLRLTDKNGVQAFVGDNLLVIGPSSGGGGGGGTVDPTTIAATGDVKYAYGTSVISGWVRLNAQTIGSATSGANERANADCQALFQYLWNTDSNLAVSGGRGASAAADWAANKTITLPDARGRVLAGLDGMGNFAAGRLTSSYFGAGATTLGSASGSESKSLGTSNLPPYTPSGTFSGTTSLNVVYYTGSTSDIVGVTTAGGARGATTDASKTFIGQSAVSGSISGTAQGGTSTPFSSLPPMMLLTFYIKL